MKGIDQLLFDQQFRGLEKSLELTWRRNDAITSNIANAETPQYRAVDLNFSQELDRAFGGSSTTLAQTDSRHLDLASASDAHLEQSFAGATKPDGNNVDIDIEMGRLAYNSGRYSLTTIALKKKFSMLVNAIRSTT